MISIILWALFAYCLYRFIFSFLIPVIRVSRQMKQRVRDFQNQVHQQAGQSSPETDISTPASEKAGEYIEFEEIKDK